MTITPPSNTPSLFTNQVALISGASSGMGKELAAKLAAQGCHLALVGRQIEKLEAMAEKLRSKSVQVRCYEVDLCENKDILNLKNRLAHDFDRLDLLIHSAGVIVVSPLKEASLKDFDLQYQVNVRAPFLLTQSLLPLLIESQGQIVFINSKAGLNSQSQTNTGLYAATKHALKAIADSLREEINIYGVRVLSIFPGRTATPMQQAIFTAENREYRPERLIQPEDVATTIINALSLSKNAEITDLTIRPFNKYQ